MKPRGLSLAVLAALAVIAASCSSNEPPAAGSGCKPDIASIQSTIFGPRCASATCHGATRPAGGIDLSSRGVEGRLVGVASTCPDRLLVAPGDPSRSFLVEKITNDEPACGGDRMPKGGTLASEDVACISSWIASLANVADGGGADGSTGGVDAGPTVACGGGETACGAACVDTKTDAKNCGACGKVCTEPFCVDGACSNVCTKTECAGACVDTTTDANNCGGCGTKCTGGKICVAGGCTCGTSPATLASIQASTFGVDCTGAGCHAKVGQRAPAEGLDLSSAALSYQTLVGVASSTCTAKTRVVAGDVANSYLVNKITGIGICTGSKMPKGGNLTAGQLDAIRSWICDGAKP